MARVPFIREGEAPPEVEEIYAKATSRQATIYNLLQVMAHSPKLLLNFMRLGNMLLRQTEITDELRELTILSVAESVDSDYIWAAHYSIGLEVGLKREQIDAISNWRGSNTFNPEERAVLRYVDVLIGNSNKHDDIDKVFNELKKYCNDKIIVELTMLIGYYRMVANFVVALGVELESEHLINLKELLGIDSSRKQITLPPD